MSINIIGISGFYHDSSCCIIKDGVLCAAVQEERFTRIKADASLPKNSFKYCLEKANLSISDIDCLAYYEDPQQKYSRQIWSGIFKDKAELYNHNPNKIELEIREVLGYEGPIKYFNHHLSHAASSFYFSGFQDAAILTVDGVGEWATTTYGTGSGKDIDIFEEVYFPHSIGLLYSTITKYLGFGVNDGEYKVMGLAPYGKALYNQEMKTLLKSGPGGQYELDMNYFDFLAGERMFTEQLPLLFGKKARMEDEEMLQFHKDVAKSLQEVLEETLIEKATYLHEKTGLKNLCMAGGVALNCVANGKILKGSPFEKLFVQPASNDAGCALGAAAAAYVELSGKTLEKLKHVYLGPEFSDEKIAKTLSSTAIKAKDFSKNPKELYELTAKKIAEGKVIGWFQGRMEFGPRSLGARSIIADPRNPLMRDRINGMVKKRESFRPFAPAILESRTRDFFNLDHPSPFMLETCDVTSPISLPAITHFDNSARVQTVNADTNPVFAALLTEFERLTGCPILLNTSFNVKGEPIVCTPEDALKCFIKTDIDCLVLGSFFLDRSENSFEIVKMILDFEEKRQRSISHEVYTFI